MFSKTLLTAFLAVFVASAEEPTAQLASAPTASQPAQSPKTEEKPTVATHGKVIPYWKRVAGAHNPSDRPLETRKLFVVQPGASFLQLELVDIRLPGESCIEVVSMRDGDSQRLTGSDLDNGRIHSAYFNGDALLVRLIAGPRTAASSVTIRSLAVGVALQPGTDDLCGSDDRVDSNHPAIGRVLYRRGTSVHSCTAWLIGTNSSFATAGHCLDGATDVIVQFNVPLSFPSGALRNPPAVDQHRWFSWTSVFENRGVGRDWGVFRTSRRAFLRQLVYFSFASPPRGPAVTIGYGSSAEGRRNFTQKNGAGSIGLRVGNRIRHNMDSTPGTSGGPIVVRGLAVGIHTHGGCGWLRRNNGTNVRHPGFAAAARASIRR